MKIGAQVMFCKNDPSTAKAFYNGRIGRVEAINGDRVTVLCGSSRIEVGPLPWVNTRYTFDHAIINAGRAFSHGQVYVALSRCRTLEGLVLATPITSDVITTDPDVVQFNEYATAHEPTAEMFLRDRRSFIEDTLCDIFDFQAISMRLRYFARLAAEHLSAYFPAYARAAADTATQVDADLLAVGIKFQQQIRKLIPLTDSFNSNTALRERIRKGMGYYASTTARILGEFFELEQPVIDNARVREHISNEYQILRTAYDEKMAIFIACINDFSLTAYWDAKACASMTEDAPKKRTSRKSKTPEKVFIDTDRITNPTLYRRILDWRSAVAKERHLPAGYIMTIRTVIGISNLQPRTPEELLSVPGVGPKTIADFGPDLLELVAASRS